MIKDPKARQTIAKCLAGLFGVAYLVIAIVFIVKVIKAVGLGTYFLFWALLSICSFGFFASLSKSQ